MRGREGKGGSERERGRERVIGGGEGSDRRRGRERVRGRRERREGERKG